MTLLNLEYEQFDVITAFLHSDIPQGTEVYVEQPHGYSDGSDRVCLLRKALYGLRTSPLWWFETFTPVVKDLDFESLTTEVCLFYNKALRAYLVIYVDDMLVSAPTSAI